MAGETKCSVPFWSRGTAWLGTSASSAVTWKPARQGLIERRSDGLFDQDQSRVRYIAHLRSERSRSPRSTADAEHTAVKTEMLKLRLMEKHTDLLSLCKPNLYARALQPGARNCFMPPSGFVV